MSAPKAKKAAPSAGQKVLRGITTSRGTSGGQKVGGETQSGPSTK